MCFFCGAGPGKKGGGGPAPVGAQAARARELGSQKRAARLHRVRCAGQVVCVDGGVRLRVRAAAILSGGGGFSNMGQAPRALAGTHGGGGGR